ncbi:MAG: glycosyltransferase [Rouxiella badensis]|jgi:sterol 3beta-glucosyltransferase|uniref:glycosyltransferase n=2 Tax=Rouxiella badensis TaxID=1646377 RepID=UPI001D138CDC|nr:glycosyltransferase [Rouxiella badensis]MCC3719274.1 glycosyltransferase [Rouxiella badensis]MCC3728524.1 glycosyltransferase [Rouxiella badensis]MCC3739480.1 glycosyltransferase [Rouxiella badensis]
MKISIFTAGSMGDIRPFIVLGKRLQQMGHQCSIMSGERNEKIVTEEGLGYDRWDLDLPEARQVEQGLMDGDSARKAAKKMSGVVEKLMSLWVEQAVTAAKDSRLIIAANQAVPLAMSVGEKFDIPVVTTYFAPLTPSSSIPPFFLKKIVRLPGFINLAVWKLLRLVMWRFVAKSFTACRASLELPDWRWSGPWSDKSNGSRKILYAFSQHLVPRPKEWPEETIKITGNWFGEVSSTQTVSPELERFIAEGESPIYVGFGSMASSDPEGLTQKIINVIKRSGVRAVIMSGGGAISAEMIASARLPGVLCVDSVSHEWLFPRVKTVFHHGGGGTVAAAARAGTPQVIMPFIYDQFYWAWQLEELGVSGGSLDMKRVGEDDIENALNKSFSTEVVNRAKKLWQQVNQENGVDNTISELQHWGFL